MKERDLGTTAMLLPFYGDHITDEAYCGSRHVYCLVLLSKALSQRA